MARIKKNATPRSVVPVELLDPLPSENELEVSSTVLQDLIPEITALARKIGGFDKLAEIAGQLARGEPTKN